MENQRPYDVFIISFGEPYVGRFTSSLHKTLTKRGIHTFILDKETLSEGNEITPSLVKNNNPEFIIPVFYDGNHPSEMVQIYVRRSCAEALANHEHMLKEDKEKVQKCRNALSQVVGLSGWTLKELDWMERYEYDVPDDVFEVELEHKLEKEVSRKLDSVLLRNVHYTVGLDSRLREVKLLLELESDEVLTVGIYGIGGIGKTTLAAAVYSRIADQFEALCFLSNVRESSNIHGLRDLHNMLLYQMTRSEHIRLIGSEKESIRYRLHQMKVLLVLDDVDTLEQLEALAGGPHLFGSGSRVIITTQDRSLLAFHGVERRHEVQELNHIEALELLSHCVFKPSIVDPNYIEVFNRAATYACGNPLVLKVIGATLFEKTVEQCECALDRFERVPPMDIWKALKISYDALDGKEKSIFLDITCCFIGYELTQVEDILRARYGQSIKYHIEVLINKSLINISSDGKVTSHPLIESMGKEIIRQESPEDPGKRSRLWFPEDIVQVLKNNKGSSKIEIIHLDSPLIEEEEEIEWDGEAFKEMKNLRILIIRKCHFSKAPKYLPKRLKVLEWWRYPSEELPSDFNSKQLVICKLRKISHAVPQVSQTSQSDPDVYQVMLQISHRIFQAETTWRIIGLMSSVVGLSCYALSPSFNCLIGKWKAFKFFLYGVLSLAILTTLMFAKQSSLSIGHGKLKTYMNFAVLMIISVYSFFYDRAINEKPEILSVVSNAAFALASLSLHRLINLGFEIGVFSYFLGCFTVQLLTINWMFIFVALFIGFPLFVMRSSLNFQQEIASGDHVNHPSSQSNPNVDSGGQASDQSSQSNPNVDSGGQAVDPSSHSNPNVDSGGQATDQSSQSNPNVDSGGQVTDQSSQSNPNVDSGGQNVDSSSHSNPNVDSGGQSIDPSSHSNPNVDSGGQVVDPSSNFNPNVNGDGQHVIDIPSEF